MANRTILQANGDRRVMTDAEEAELAIDQKAVFSALIVEEMVKRQDGGIIFNGLKVATDTVAVADLSGGMQKARPGRKVVTRAGKGSRAGLDADGFQALFDAVEDYRYSVMAYAYDLLEQVDAAGDPSSVDIETGWPSNVFNV